MNSSPFIPSEERKRIALERFRPLRQKAGSDWARLLREMKPELPKGWDITLMTRNPERNGPDRLEKLVELLEEALGETANV